jgi:hypothetical protein
MGSRREMFSIIVALSVVTVFPSLSAVGSWEEVLLLSKDFTVSYNFLFLSLCYRMHISVLKS